MKKIEIIPIAERKMQRRGIKTEWVIDAINNPEQVVSGYSGRAIAQKKFSIAAKEYLLRVVYEETNEMYNVITSYLTSDIKRYWSEGPHLEKEGD